MNPSSRNAFFGPVQCALARLAAPGGDRQQRRCRAGGGWSRVVCRWLLALPLTATAAAGTPLVIAYLGPAGSDSAAGARQGTDEANAHGRFLGLTYQLEAVPDVAEAIARHAIAVVVATESTRLAAVAAAAVNTPVINVADDDDRLRGQCIDNLFHTIPSQAMRADAVKQWREAHADSQAGARAWHASAEKYAGSQLNKRFSDRVGRPMTDQAWAGWAAVKLLSDTVAHHRAVTPAALLAALHAGIEFDGQKGVDMSFRDNGQLRQPLVLVEHDQIVGEAPVRGAGADRNLDSLGPTHCPGK